MNNENLEKLKDIVNKELQEGKSLKSILKKYGVQKKDFIKVGYTYNVDIKQFAVATKEVPPLEVQEEVQKEILVDVLQKQEKQDNVIQLKRREFINNNLDVLEQIILQFKQNTEIMIDSNNINIVLPHEENKNFKISMRVNEEVWKIFKEFCNNNKQFKQKELLSQALLEYVKNHS